MRQFKNKMHYTVHGNTAAEVIAARADHNKETYGAYILEDWKTKLDAFLRFNDADVFAR